MTPDLDTIARRRHLVTIILRCATLAWIAYSLLEGAETLVNHLDGFLIGGVGPVIVEILIPLACRLALAAGVLLLERPLLRWLVPASLGDGTCPRCGYSLKNLKSPVCPECGMSLRPSA